MMQPLGAVCEIIMGQAPAGDTYNEDRIGLPLIAGASDFGKITPKPTRFTSAAAKISRPNDIILCVRATIGDLNWSDGDYCLGRGVAGLRVNERKADRNYVWRALEHGAALLSSLGRGATFKQISKPDIANFEIRLPPLSEQKRIAAILDQADEIRRKRQCAIDHLNQLGRAIFYDMFGDPKANPRGLPWFKLGKIADFYSGNSLPEGEAFVGQSDGHLLLKVSDLNHHLNQQDIVCAANWSAARGSRAGTCPPNSLIFPKRGGAISTNKKRWLRRSAILDPNLMGVHPNETVLTMSFLNGWFQTFNLNDIASGSSVPQLNKQDLAPLEIGLPPIAEQAEYAARMEALAGTRQAFMLASECDRKMFSTLQHRAFEGKL